MTETKELKPKSFRIDEETAEKFKAISTELGNNQQQTLSKLIEAYEFQKGKSVLTQKKAEIETFENYVTILTRMYMYSLEQNENITKTTQAEFEALLVSKDETILSLQQEVKKAEETAKIKEEEAKQTKQESEELEKKVGQLESLITTSDAAHAAAIEDKEKLILALTEACDSLKKDMENMQKETLERSAIATKQMQLQKEYNQLKLENTALLNEQEQLKLSHERQLLQQEISFTKQLPELEQKRKQEIDEYQKKYLDLLDQLQQKTKPVRIVKKINK